MTANLIGRKEPLPRLKTRIARVEFSFHLVRKALHLKLMLALFEANFFEHATKLHVFRSWCLLVFLKGLAQRQNLPFYVSDKTTRKIHIDLV
jgi:hypothetical protein